MNCLATVAVITLPVVVGACAMEPDDGERFVETARRMASLPDTCSDTQIVHYERVKTENFRDGEFFKVDVSVECHDAWIKALAQTADFICYDGLDDQVLENPLCFAGAEPLVDGVNVFFRDNTQIELFWIELND